MFWAQSVFSILTDAIIMLLPVSSLWKLSIPKSKKIALSLLCGTGLLACVASALRIVHFQHVSTNMLAVDISQHGLFIGLLTTIESSIGFLVACSLCFPMLFRAKGQRVMEALSCLWAPKAASSAESRVGAGWSRPQDNDRAKENLCKSFGSWRSSDEGSDDITDLRVTRPRRVRASRADALELQVGFDENWINVQQVFDDLEQLR
ncbi:hypothetical protein CC86DRAFT_16581 [Ophiobolus disseminans]|uniref:Rhodopsin domain-containing protein n=1 Tax=Ophiobolus disseminans TaxID=1469910 RepID=A0A6A7AN62_9PLEO|nr:hypothetical protein CC86DRAFT_16581 [Ophiobolus disseminans]